MNVEKDISDVEICIVDTVGKNSRIDSNVLLMWTACLFFEKSSASCYAASALDMMLSYDSVSESTRFRWYMDLMRKNEGSQKEILESIEQQHDFIQLLRKKKGKTQPEIVWLKRAEKDEELRYKQYKDWVGQDLENMKIASLLPLSTHSISNRDNALLVWWLNDNSQPEDNYATVKFFTSLIRDSRSLPFFVEGIWDDALFIDLETLLPQPAAVEKAALCTPLFDFPEPLTLTAQQTQVVRSEMAAIAWPFMKKIADMGDEIETISFTADTISSLAALYKEKVAPLKTAMQSAIDNNPYFNAAKQDTDNKRTCRLWLGISSHHTVYNFYTQQHIIDISSEAYSKEETARHVALENSRLFLFLETIEN